MKKLAVAVQGLILLAACLAADDKPPGQAAPIPAAWSGKITDAAQLPVERSAWGTLQWVCNEKLMPGSAQTVGLATIFPGKQNPVHHHPNCEEVLYVISGQGQQSYDGRTVLLTPGMTIRIPSGVKHNMLNTGTESLRTLVSFSSGDRKTVFLEENAGSGTSRPAER
jgi:mannose-6-phosphate isomerase-like protein (cupin superfamily)